MDADKARTVLEAMGVGGWPGVYVLGSIDRRITIYSQQIRALNLAAALFASDRVKADDPVVVVGAGAAGLTCAAGLRHLGANVTVLEARADVLPLFRGGSSRWLHPGVYDWPLEGWSRDRAGLPLLDWMHGPVADVRIAMEAGWSAVEERGNVQVHHGATRVKLANAGDTPRTVTWNPQGSQRTKTVILAVGFGLERAALSSEKRYWEGDDLDVITVDGKRRRWLVSGSGDGALTDLFRLCLRDFRHERMVADLVPDMRTRGIQNEIRRIESDAAIQDDPVRLHEAYAALDAPWVIKAMADRIRPDSQVTLNAPSAEFLDRGASALNRFLAAQLHRAGAFELLPGKIADAKLDGDQVVVTFEDKTAERFDRIVRRHGPEASLRQHFPLIAEAVEHDRVLRRDKPTLTDQTRSRYWRDGLFGAEQRDAPDPQAQAPKFKAVIVSADDVAPWREQIEQDLTRAGGAVELLRTGTYTERLDKVRAADVLVVLVAHRLGPIPDASDGGDGKRSWLQLALGAAQGTVVVARVDDSAPWSEKKEQDDLLAPGADAIAIATRVQSLVLLKASLTDPLVFGGQATLATPTELGTAVVMRVSAASASRSASSTRRSWVPHVQHALQPAPHFQGRASLIERLHAWWADPASPDRVMALVAIGGAGKTAIAEQTLRHVIANPSGGGVFVWSFYDAPSSGDFLTEACRYFAGDPGEDIGARLSALKTTLRGGEPHLLILDGLERVQNEGVQGQARGTLDDAPLKQLMQALAAGLGRTRALVTSRFPLADLAAWKGGGLADLRIDNLDTISARTVLRAWGVAGRDDELDAVSARVGGHALSVAVLGSYIANVGEGSPAAVDHLDLSEAGALDPQANKLARVLVAYAEALPDAERQVMARLALFPRGIELELLAQLVQDGTVAGVLIRWDQAQLAQVLTRLVHRGLAFTYRSGNTQVFTAHPFVRESFAAVLDVPAADVHRVMAAQLRASLEEQPSTRPNDGSALDRYEAVIEHLLAAGDARTAFEVYWHRLGSFNHLGNVLGDYARGSRILNLFRLDDPSAIERLENRDHFRLVNDQALFAYRQGDLAVAARLYSGVEAIMRNHEDGRHVSVVQRNYCKAMVMMGRLPRALDLANEAVSFSTSSNAGVDPDAPAYQGYVLGLMGEIEAALGRFDESAQLYLLGQPSASDPFVAKIYWRIGRRTQARTKAAANLEHWILTRYQAPRARVQADLAWLALPEEPSVARKHLSFAREWATSTGEIEVTLEVHRLEAALYVIGGDLDAALAALNGGIRAADNHGFGLFAIDLRIDRARLLMTRSDLVSAQRDARDALERATDLECGYAWGEADAAHVLGEVYAARQDLPNARRAYEQALAVRERIRHPDVEATRAGLAALPGALNS